MDVRFEQLCQWLTESLKHSLVDISPASADASFRRYFRAKTHLGVYIVMDAPPEKESITEFILIAEHLHKQGVHTPEVFAKDTQQGFILMEDLGDTTYLERLSTEANLLYSDAIIALINIQNGMTEQASIQWPLYDKNLLDQEMELFIDWYLLKHKQITLNQTQKACWLELKEILIRTALQQPQTWVHRDYHSRNLMVTETNSPGVIDFQDMVIGPISYDLASVFKDCYIQWPRERQLGWLQQFHCNSKANYSLQDLIRWYDFIGLQRHLKVLGIFCRLNYRDGKQQYLKDLSTVASYIIEVIDLYDEFSNFKHHFLNTLDIN